MELNKELEKELVCILENAWMEYIRTFGEPPHGTEKQLSAMCEFGVFRGVSRLLSQAIAAREKEIEERNTGMISILSSLKIRESSLIPEGELWICKDALRSPKEETQA